MSHDECCNRLNIGTIDFVPGNRPFLEIDAIRRQRFQLDRCSYSMSSVSSEEDLEQINVKVTESFRKRIDDTWQGRGFNSRSEFIRFVLHDAVENPTFDRDELLAIALGERDIREGRIHSREEILEAFDLELDNEDG